MSKLWVGIMIISLVLLVFTSPENALSAMMAASTNAVSLSIKLIAVYAVWLGLIEIVKETKLSEKLASLLSPIIDFIFGKLPKDAKQYIAMNMSFNMLGVGNAATPTAIKAMQLLGDKSTRATTAMLMLLVINATSIQLIPTTIIGMRAASSAIDPSNIILPTLIASAISTIVGILLVKICSRFHKKPRTGQALKKGAQYEH